MASELNLKSTTETFKVLIIEDTPNDVELISRTLERARMHPQITVVDTLTELNSALENSSFDLILSDYNLPNFNGLQALEISKLKMPGVPFILVSGAVGEERAVDLMHAGARDFVSKANLKRLIPTIQRELAVRNRTDVLEKELLSTLENMSEGFLTLDRNWIVTYVNSEAVTFLQGTRESLLGKTLKDLFPSTDLENFITRYRSVLKNGTPEKFIETYENRVFHIHAIRTAHGGISIFFRDITEQVDAERKQQELLTNLDIAKREAEKANQLKSAFLANMSHEIRTPLGAILGFADLLRDPTMDAAQTQSFIDIIVRSGYQLSHLINDILDLSKVESGHLTMERVPVDLVQAVQEVIALLKVKAKEKSLELTLTVEGSLPKLVQSDPVRIKQILTNVIGNAIKFTHVGSVQVKMSHHKDQIAIEVKDTGVGINPQETSHLFQVFRQADSSVTRKFGGTGLGLALSRALAQALGGDIVLAKTEPQAGSTFLITLSCDEVPGADLVSASVSEAEVVTDGVFPGMKVLLVEDLIDNQELISHILSKSGVRLDVVDNAPEGIKKALKGAYDVVLMDIQMPQMDGYTATQSLREQGFASPIIALTAHAMTEVRVKCLEVGFTDYLTKPIDAKALIKMVGRFKETSEK